MKYLNKIAILLTIVFSYSAAICGYYISQEAVIEQSSMNFHIAMARLSLVSSMVTMYLLNHKNRQAIEG